jgi:hypothetical protein
MFILYCYITINSMEGFLSFIYTLLICILVVCMRLTMIYNTYPKQILYREVNSIDF